MEAQTYEYNSEVLHKAIHNSCKSQNYMNENLRDILRGKPVDQPITLRDNNGLTI